MIIYDYIDTFLITLAIIYYLQFALFFPHIINFQSTYYIPPFIHALFLL